MPIAVRSPEEILRTTKADLYFIEFLFPGKVYTMLDSREPENNPTNRFENGPADCPVDRMNPPGRAEIIDWIESNLAGTKWEILAPHERSGFIVGGIEGRICVHFGSDELEKFCSKWEVDNHSIDPRFQLGYIRYEVWQETDLGPPDWDDL